MASLRRNLLALCMALALVATACGTSAETAASTTADTDVVDSGDDTTTTTAEGPTTTGGGASADDTTTTTTTTEADDTATTEAETTTTATTEAETTTTVATLPPSIAEAAFAFAAGTDPRIRIKVFVGESSTGPWNPAGAIDPTPTVDGSKYWVRFTVANRDSLGNVTAVAISGSPPDPGPIGTDVCPLTAELEPSESTECILGGTDGFDVDPAGAEHFFVTTGLGFRQGVAPEVYFNPPIPESVGYDNAPHRFILVFDSPPLGVRIDGIAHDPDVPIDLPVLSLSSSVRVDCTDGFPGGVSAVGGSPTAGEPKLVAYVIGNFNADGSDAGSCSEIPKQDLDFELTGDSDFSLSYATS